MRKKILTDISPKLDRIVEAAAGNKSDREMIAAITADNLTVTSKLDAVLEENQRVLAKNRRFKARLDAMEQEWPSGSPEEKSEDGAERGGKTASEVKTELARLGAEIARLKQETPAKTPDTEHRSTAEGEVQTEMNSLGVHCPVHRGEGRFSKYLFSMTSNTAPCARRRPSTSHVIAQRYPKRGRGRLVRAKD